MTSPNTEQDKELEDLFIQALATDESRITAVVDLVKLTKMLQRREERLLREARIDELYKYAQVTVGLNAEDSMKALAKYMADRIAQLTKEREK